MRGVDARRTFLQYDCIFIEIALVVNKYVYTQATGVRRALRLTDRDPSWYDVSGPDPRCTTLQINQHCQSW